jgi:hypothetical protein
MSNGGDKSHHSAPAGAEAKTSKAVKSGNQQSKPTSTAKPRAK